MEISMALLCVGVATLFAVLVYIMWSDRKLNKLIKEFKEKMRESERSLEGT
jgi:FtsZ-interacting cell division protein ZipA